MIRDAGRLRASQKKNALKAMAEMSLLISGGVDIATIAADLRQYAARKGWFEGDLPEFTPAEPKYFGPEMTLARSLREQTERRAAQLQEADRSIRDLLMQQATMLSATENINLQNRVTLLTWVLVFLTVVITILMAIAAFEPSVAILKGFK